MRAPVRVSFVLAAVAAGGNAAAQGARDPAMPAGYRDVIVRKLELERNLLLAMVDSMPERLLRDRATPAQRDFAQQVHHAASSVAGLGARHMNRPMPALPDTAGALHSRAGLHDYVAKVYDFAIATARGQSPEELRGVVSFFRLDLPRWQVWDELHLHTIWTAGQIVANFRKHGMAPPGFAFF